MPHTLPPASVYPTNVNPLLAGAKSGPVTGDTISATVDDSAHPEVTSDQIKHANVDHASAIHPERHSQHRMDSFFHRGGSQEAEQQANIAREVGLARASSYAADADRAARSESRSRSRVREKVNASNEAHLATEGHLAHLADEERRRSRSGSRQRSHLASEVIGKGPETRGAAGFGST